MTLQEKFQEMDATDSAVLATNFYNFETISGVLRAASNLNQPIILQASPSTIQYLGVEVSASLARSTLKKYGVEGWLHLDHAGDIDMIRKCLDAGFDSVMIDASEKSFEENVKITSAVTKLAESYGANVEAELGYVAKLGQSHTQEGFTKPDEAKAFVEQTGVDALAVAIGSAHGFYKKKPNLDLNLLKEIRQAVSCALVLHGGSGIPDIQLQKGIRYGIRKINLATEIKDIFMQTLQNTLKNNDEIDLRKIFPVATDEVTGLVERKLIVITDKVSTLNIS